MFIITMQFYLLQKVHAMSAPEKQNATEGNVNNNINVLKMKALNGNRMPLGLGTSFLKSVQ